MVGKYAGGKIFNENFSRMKGWMDRFFFIDRKAIPDAMAWRHHDSDVYDAFSDNDFSLQDVQSLTEKIIDLYLVPLGILFGAGLATTWDFPGFFPVFKDTRGNVVTMSEYLCFPFLSGVSIMQGAVVPANHLTGQNTTPSLSADQPIPDITDSQQEVKVEDPKTKKKKRKSASASSNHVSSSVPLRTVAPTNQVIPIHNENKDGEPNILNDENRSASHSPRGSASESVHNFVNVEEEKEQYPPPHIKPFINLSGPPIHPAKEPVFLSETNADGSSHPLNNVSIVSLVSKPREILSGRNVEEGESSRSDSVYILKWAIPLRCRVDTPEWCRELMVHLASPAA
ncbi:hypothetical protein Tco_0903329 [Tanacetum coccineum]